MNNLKDIILAATKDLFNKVKTAVKEFLRVALLAVVSYLLTDGIELAVNALGVRFQLDPSSKLLLAGVLTSALKAIDRQLHENASARAPEDQNTGLLGLKGLTGF